MKINMNHYVKIKLNQRGLEIHREKFDELKKFFPKLGDYRPPKVDSEGWHREQLWSVMLTYGPHIRMGAEPPFQTEIIVGKPAQ